MAVLTTAATPLVTYKQYTFSGMKDEVLTRVNDPDGDTYSLRADELLYEGISALVLSDYNRDGYPSLVVTDNIVPTLLSLSYRIQVAGAAREISQPMLKILALTDDLNAADDTGTGINDHRFIPIDLTQYNRMNDANERPFDDEIYYYRQGDFIYMYPNDRTIGKVNITYVASPHEYSSDEIMNYHFSLDFIYKTVEYAAGRIREQQAGE
mgnify:FL=1|jgi:hypothetical protein|tara:strand:- start:1112 stop:1741 length:630 start_codon:yes stop_codon:yes gene_type:complete